MAVYACVDMIRDCRDNRPDGWVHLVQTYTPVLRGILGHYYPQRASDVQLLSRVWLRLKDPGSILFARPGPSTERQFVSELRQAVLAAVENDRASASPAILLDLDALTEALRELTATERQMVWFETLAYDSAATARILNIETSTVENARSRAAEMLRSHLDSWNAALLADNGPQLGRAAAGAKTDNCLPPSAFLDAIDGRITWARKQGYEAHLTACWHCVDHFCRIREADAALHGSAPLSEVELEPFRELLGLPQPRKSMWEKARALVSGGKTW